MDCSCCCIYDMDGAIIGLQTIWDKEGDVIKTETYKDGKLVK